MDGRSERLSEHLGKEVVLLDFWATFCEPCLAGMPHFPILLDQETRVVALYNPKTSAPYSVLIGRDGRILKKQEGYTTGDAGAVDRDVVAALAR